MTPETATATSDRPAAPRVTAAVLTDALLHAWSDVLNGVAVAPDADVFQLGGHSLLVGRVAVRIRHDLGLDLPFAWFFEHPTAASLAAAWAADDAGR